MSSLASLSLLFLAIVSTALARLSGAAPRVRLWQQQQQQQEQQQRNGIDDRHSHVRLDSNESAGSKLDYGDLTCMRWTGGECAIAPCHEERGTTECVEAQCMCPAGYCANAVGACERHTEGDWIGTYAMSFEKPYLPEKSYVGANKPGDASSWKTEYLVATADSERQWKIALTPRAHVRFESTRYPGNILTIYVNRRRRTQSQGPQFVVPSGNGTSRLTHRRTVAKHDAHHHGSQVMMDEDLDEHLRERDALRDEHGTKVKITDLNDLWPILLPLEDAHPIYATFRVRPTAKDGGGYEIWDPQTQVALSSANPDLYFADSETYQSIAECDVADGECDGHQLVTFEPKLPLEATPLVGRDVLTEHGVLHWWQKACIFGGGFCVVCFAFIMRDDRSVTFP